MVNKKLFLGPLLETVRVLPAIRFEELTLHPLCWKPGASRRYLTLDEALAAGEFRVTEVSQEGRVPELKVENRGGDPVFILDGEILEGGKQTRVLNTGVLVDARQDAVIPVSCVESGRWSYRRALFGSPRSSSHSKLRAMKAAMVAKSRKAELGAFTDQGAIWDEVKLLHRSSHSRSPTQEYLASVLTAQEQARKFLKEVRLPPEAQGVAVTYGSRLLSVDLFDRAETLEKLWSKLAGGLALDLFREKEGSAAAATPGIEEALGRAAASSWDVCPGAAHGEELHLEERGLVGSGISLGGEVIHLAMFAADQQAVAEPTAE